MGVDIASANDILQETILKILKKVAHTLRLLKEPRAWMMQVARNTCLDFLRQSNRNMNEIRRWQLNSVKNLVESQQMPN